MIGEGFIHKEARHPFTGSQSGASLVQPIQWFDASGMIRENFNVTDLGPGFLSRLPGHHSQVLPPAGQRP